MTLHFTLGAEEEFQMVDKQSCQLASRIHPIMEKGVPLMGEHIKPEMLQSAVEIITDICPDIAALRHHLQQLRNDLARLLDTEGLSLISAGTHPMAHWKEQARTNNPRYEKLEEEFQDVGRSILIFGMHIHVSIEKHEHAIPLMNQLRSWIPHMLAISSNSPFWCGRYTGMRSYRSIVWKRFPRSGIPNLFHSTSEFDNYVEDLVQVGCIDNGKRIWWDIRPHPFFPTVEFRMCDMPATIEDTLAIAALCQALVAKLTWMLDRNQMTGSFPQHYIEENKWRAARYGLDAEIADFAHNRRISMRDSISETLDFVDDVLDDLGSRREINYLRGLLQDPRGTGADRQIAVYEETGSLQAVAQFLVQQMTSGFTPNAV